MQRARGLEYEVTGEGEPVLLIHGSHIAESFLPLTRQAVLADRYRLIRYHRRGFAGSARHAGPFSIEDQAKDALGVLEQLGLECAHVVGHSYGAVTAIQVALSAPSAVHSLCLLEPPLMSAEVAAAFGEMLAPAVEAYGAGDGARAVDLFMTLVGGADWRNEVSAVLPGGVAQAERDAATFFEVELPALPSWTFDGESLSRLGKPVLFVIGAESGALFEAPRQLFEASVPQAEPAVLPGLNHSLQMQDPKLVADALADFLARQPF